MYALTCTCMHFVTHGHTECMSICVPCYTPKRSEILSSAQAPTLSVRLRLVLSELRLGEELRRLFSQPQLTENAGSRTLRVGACFVPSY